MLRACSLKLCDTVYFAAVVLGLVFVFIGVVVTAGLSPFGLDAARETACLSVLTPTNFPNTGAATVTAILVLSGDEPFGTLPVYEHTPPQPYFMVDDDATFRPFSKVTVGGRTLPPRLKFRGP